MHCRATAARDISRPRSHQARIGDGGLRLLRRNAPVGQGLVGGQEVELLELPVALGRGRGGGVRQAPAHPALGDAGAERHQGEGVFVDAVGDGVAEALARREGAAFSLPARGSSTAAYTCGGGTPPWVD
jgi:hypothetical protein